MNNKMELRSRAKKEKLANIGDTNDIKELLKQKKSRFQIWDAETLKMLDDHMKQKELKKCS